jgi:hypothetical protein
MRLAWCLVPALWVIGCKGKGGDARAVCERAAVKYASCIREILGPELEAMARQRDGTAACSRDAKTVAMYRACLPKAECTAFLACLDDYAEAAQPAVASDLPRPAQCAQHVQDGLRGIAMQVVLTNEIVKRSERAMRTAQECTLDEGRPWKDCLEPPERAEVQRYATQRQADCEGWPPELAACILRLPGARDCDRDSYPFWQLPIEQGAAGPPVAWTTELTDDDDYENDAALAWTGDGTLIVRDERGLRALRDGKPRWQAAPLATDPALSLTSTHVALRGKGADDGVHLYELATGTHRRVLAGGYVDAVGAAGEEILAITTEGELFSIAPARCVRPASCATRLGALEDAPHTSRIGGWQEQVVLASTDALVLADRKARGRLELSYDVNDVVLTPDGAIVTDDRGIAVLAFAGCRKAGPRIELASTRTAVPGCVIERHAISWASSVEPTPLAGGAFAFNDHGIVENTQHVGPPAAWQVKTNGAGRVAGDAAHVYTVSMGLDGRGPVRLLALARDSGKVAWQTDLPGASPEASSLAIAVVHRDRRLAVRVGTRVFVIALH